MTDADHHARIVCVTIVRCITRERRKNLDPRATKHAIVCVHRRVYDSTVRCPNYRAVALASIEKEASQVIIWGEREQLLQLLGEERLVELTLYLRTRRLKLLAYLRRRQRAIPPATTAASHG